MGDAEPTPTQGWKGSLFGPIGLVVALAVGLRAIAAVSEEVIFGDGPEFVRIAEALVRGDLREALEHRFHPLTSAAMALVHAVAGVSLEGAGRIVSVLAGGAATLALYGLAHAGWGPKAALVAALLFAVHPRMIAVSSSVQSDGLHLALFLSAALATWGALSRQSARAALAAGLLCGLAYLTRPEGMAVCAVFGVGLGALLLSRRVQATRAFALGCAFALALLAVSGPYLVALRESSGSWTLTQKKSVAGILQVDQLARSVPLPPEGPTGTSRRHPAPQRRQPARLAEGGAVGAALGEVVQDGIRALHPVFLVLVLLGVRLRQPSAHTLYVLAYAGLFFGVLVGLRLEAGYVSRRHWLVVVAMLLPYAGRGLVEGVQAVARRWADERFLRSAVWGAVGIVAAAFALDAVLPDEEPAKLARKEAALWLRETEHVQVLSAPRRRIAYYAEADRWVPVPKARDPATFVQQLRTAGAGFLVVEERSVPEELREGTEGLRLLHRVSDPPEAVLVFRLEGARRPDVGAGP